MKRSYPSCDARGDIDNAFDPNHPLVGRAISAFRYPLANFQQISRWCWPKDMSGFPLCLGGSGCAD